MPPLPFQFRRIALATGVLLLAACATVDEHRSPEIALPPAFVYATMPSNAATIKADWWRVYGDAELNRLLQRVGESNAELAQAEARWRQAMAQVDAARALAFPQLGVGASITRSGGTASSTLGGGTGTRQIYATGLDLSWAPAVQAAPRARAWPPRRMRTRWPRCATPRGWPCNSPPRRATCACARSMPIWRCSCRPMWPMRVRCR